jgi:hypothetical protein
MSARQAYKVMLLGLAVPIAAVIVEVGHALVAPTQPLTASEQTTLASRPPQSPPTADLARFSLASEPASTWQPPPNVPPVIVPPAAPPLQVATRQPVADEPTATAATANSTNDSVSPEAQGVESAPADAGDSL